MVSVVMKKSNLIEIQCIETATNSNKNGIYEDVELLEIKKYVKDKG